MTTRLQVTPRVVGNGRIVLAIAVKDEVEVERINTAFLIAPVVATRQTVTQADVEDGGTVVISGLRQDAFQNDDRGVPWLSKVPVLGWLFKSELTETTRRELVVFLTAKIVTSPGQAGVAPSPALPAAPGLPVPPGVPAAPGVPSRPACRRRPAYRLRCRRRPARRSRPGPGERLRRRSRSRSRRLP